MKGRQCFAVFCWYFLLMVYAGGCVEDTEEEEATEAIDGYRPIYVSYEEMKNVFVAESHPLKDAGKLYVRGSLLFVNEINKGIHIIDNQNPAAPQSLAFIHIPGNVDLAIKNNTLYADNATDLLTIDVSNPQQPKLIKRIPAAFPYAMFPPMRGVRFECVDKTKGVVVGWEKAELYNPKCYR